MRMWSFQESETWLVPRRWRTLRKEFLYLYLHHQNYKNHIFCFSFLSHCCADLSLIKYFKNINQTTFNGQPVYRAAQQGNDRAPEMDFSVLFWISSVNHGAARPRWEFVLHYESTHITETETELRHGTPPGPKRSESSITPLCTVFSLIIPAFSTFPSH